MQQSLPTAGPVRMLVTPRCGCQQACVVKQTFKDGPNRERHFFVCAKKKCKTFHWLDEQLPKCRHGRTRMRRVLKLGANNGRHFASCPQRQGCGFFQWLCWQDESSESIGSDAKLQARLRFVNSSRHSKACVACMPGAPAPVKGAEGQLRGLKRPRADLQVLPRNRASDKMLLSAAENHVKHPAREWANYVIDLTGD